MLPDYELRITCCNHQHVLIVFTREKLLQLGGHSAVENIFSLQAVRLLLLLFSV